MSLRPYHIIQVLVILAGIPLLARTLGPAVKPGMLALILVIGFAIVALLAGLVGTLIGLRMRSFGNLVLGLLSCAVGVAAIARYWMLTR